MRVWVLMIVLVLSATASLVGCGDSVGADERYRLGAKLQEQGKFEAAIKEYDKALALDDGNVDAYHSRGEAYLNLNQAQRAIENFDQVIQLDPQIAEAYYNRGLAYNIVARQLGRDGDSAATGEVFSNLRNAKEDFEHAVELDPGLAPIILSDLAYVSRLLGPIAELSDALSQNPLFADDYMTRGELYRKRGRFQDAIEDYDEALRLNPDLAWAYVRRSHSYRNIDQFQTALEDADEAIRINPEFWYGYLEQGISYYFLGKLTESIDAFDEALRVGIGTSEAIAYVHLIKSDAYHRLSQEKRAIQEIEDAVRIDPSYVDSYISRVMSRAGSDPNTQDRATLDDAISEKDEELVLEMAIRLGLLEGAFVEFRELGR